MNIAETIDKIYVGIVESNVDPYRLGRVKVRVLTVYDNIPLEDVPYATPFKSTDGRTFNIPAIGKIVSVVFLKSISQTIACGNTKFSAFLPASQCSLSPFKDDHPMFMWVLWHQL